VNRIRDNLTGLIVRLAKRLVPLRCAFCAAVLEAGNICRPCRTLLPWNKCYCERCGQPSDAAEAAGVACAQCQASSPPYRIARAPLIYAFPVDNVLKALKFRRQLWYLPALAELMLPVLQQEFRHCDALVPVPLHRFRQLRRGFNQSCVLCRSLHKVSGMRIAADVMRTRATRSQSGLNAAQRRQNLRNAFTVPDGLRCRRPLIVDDVITTGTTTTQIAHTLLRAGADEVSVLAVARVDRCAGQTGCTGLNV
jgi:ComF family protein